MKIDSIVVDQVGKRNTDMKILQLADQVLQWRWMDESLIEQKQMNNKK